MSRKTASTPAAPPSDTPAAAPAGRSQTARLADFMCFTIYSANLAYSRVYKPVLEQLGVTYPQYITIIALWEEDRQTVKSLSEKLFLEPSTMTPMLQRLESMGYVTRTRDDEDERSVRVSLTEAGRQLREKGFGFGEMTVKASGLPPDEFRALQRAVARLRDNLRQAGK
ncbi:MarR family transcriptional regulator (plasmid) [Azospirillum oryzae]|uniref:MarR family transcriptional regulator n=1 Tax=Azospirillum oryzae TaxID=286727 RepID=A0A6N1AG65_9PROT|nr:MarR family transcriptional regulator [Azospirillum oryzae]KAA0587433.1 MarR family transcriptional regulator [Azospirillum oryzae]QKS50510.1 MarR family transcriptional regulator [Azospirillum oryzae]GLR78767.1 MarR family transcriptional regulator [Azospirillum oryzae]